MTQGLRQFAKGIGTMAGSGYKDYFQVLGVDRGADADAIKRFRNWPVSTILMSIPVMQALKLASRRSVRRMRFCLTLISVGDTSSLGSTGISLAAGSGADVDFGRYGNFDDFINDLLGRLVVLEARQAFRAVVSPAVVFQEVDFRRWFLTGGAINTQSSQSGRGGNGERDFF